MMWFALEGGCSSTTFPNFGKSGKISGWLSCSFMTDWWQRLEVLGRVWNKLYRPVLSWLLTGRPPINHDSKPLDTSIMQPKAHACSDWTYRTDLFPILIYRSKIWTLRKQDRKRLTSIEIKLFRRTPGTTFVTTTAIKKFGRFEIHTTFEKIRRYKSNCLRGVTGTKSKKMAKTILNYRPKRQRRFWRTCTRLLEKAETFLLTL